MAVALDIYGEKNKAVVMNLNAYIKQHIVGSSCKVYVVIESSLISFYHLHFSYEKVFLRGFK